MDPVGWLREQDRAFAAVFLTGVAVVALAAVVATVVIGVAVGGLLLEGSASGGSVQAATDQTATAQQVAPSLRFAADEGPAGVTITFEGGDEVPASEVSVVLDDGHDHVHRQSWAGRVGVADGDPLPVGSSVTVGGVDPGDSLAVVYRGGEDSTVVFEYEV